MKHTHKTFASLSKNTEEKENRQLQSFLGYTETQKTDNYTAFCVIGKCEKTPAKV